MNYIDLRSDTVTLPSDDMRQAMLTAEVGDDGYGDDPTVKSLQEKVAELFAKESALFVPSGTMANQICLRILASQGDEVVCDGKAHIYRKECAAASALWGISFLPIATSMGILRPEAVAQALPLPKINHAVVKAIALENTVAYGSGAFYTIEEAAAVWDVSKHLGLKVHMDGARLFNACAAGGYSPDQIACYCDTLCFCFSKGLGAPAGSMIVSSRENIQEATRLRKMLGGTMRQVGFLAAAGRYALENNRDRLLEDHIRAEKLARGLMSISGIKVAPVDRATNIVTFDIATSGLDSRLLARQAREFGILLKPCGSSSIRAVTHMGISDQDISRSLTVIDQIVSAHP